MKINHGNWRIDLRSLIRVEWRKYYFKLIVHEKFEKHVKWILRIFTGLGILTIFLVLPYVAGIIVSIGLFLLELFFEKVLFEYSVMIIQPFPDFEVDYGQWLTNGYLLTNQEIDGHEDFINYFGPAYQDEKYASTFFKYIRSWNQHLDTDKENNICISFIYESDVSYTTYLYANPKRKWLKKDFSESKKNMQLEKHGKTQQSMVFQMIYWKNLKMKKEMFFTKFIEQQKDKDSFYFVPFFYKDKGLRVIADLSILKMHFKVKGRSELKKSEIEYHFK